MTDRVYDTYRWKIARRAVMARLRKAAANSNAPTVPGKPSTSTTSFDQKKDPTSLTT